MPDLNPTAVYIGGVSGVHRGAQLYFENDGTTALTLPYDAVLTMSAGGQVLGTYFAASGTLLSDATKWTGPQAALIAGSYSGTAAHTIDADFAKLTFASSNGWINNSARVIQVKIQALKNGELSQNSGPFLFMGINISTGNLFGNFDIDINNGIIYSSNFASENTADQGITNIRIDNEWSKNNFRTQLTGTDGINARAYADTDSPTGLSVLFSKADLDRTKLWRSHITSFDSDGFPNYGTRIDTLGVGSNVGLAPTSAVSQPCIVPQYFSSGMPLVLIGKGSQTKTSSIIANQGTPAVPDYSPSLATNAINASLIGITLMRSDSLGQVYMPRGGTLNFGQLYRINYTGANNNATALTTALNWTSIEIGNTATVSPAINGDGLTFQGRCYGVAINEDLMVNSEPTLYVTDPTNHVIFKVTRNALALGTAADYDWVVFAGTTGTAGNVDGIGLAAQFSIPVGIIYDGSGLLYVNCFGARTMRTIDTTTADVITYFGVNGVGAHVDQFSF